MSNGSGSVFERFPTSALNLAIPTSIATPTSKQAFLKVEVEGHDVSARVRSVEVEDNDRLIDKATFVLDDPGGGTATGSAAATFEEGQRVRVDTGWAGEHGILFEGEIARPETATVGRSGDRGTVVAYDLAAKMKAVHRAPRDHTGKLSVILTGLLTGYPIQPGDIKPDPDYEFTARTPLRQDQPNDWDFIQDLAHRYGARAFVEFNGKPDAGGGSKFYWVSEKALLHGDPMGHLHYCPGFSEVIEFRYRRIASGAAAQESAVTVDPATGTPQSSPSPDPRPAETTRSPVPGSSTPDSQRPVTTARGTPSNPDAAQEVRPADPTRILGLFGEGTAVGTIHLRAKGKVTISGIAAWAAGDWYVRKATHITTRTGSRERNTSTYQVKFVVTR